MNTFVLLCHENGKVSCMIFTNHAVTHTENMCYFLVFTGTKIASNISEIILAS